MRSFVCLLSACLLSACAYYPSRHLPDECATDAECNIGRTCGEMIRCVEGECDKNDTYEIPCSTACTTDADCETEEPPPDGTWYTCEEGKCVMEFDPRFLDACAADDDCVKVHTSCPSCRCEDGYEEKAINKDFTQLYLDELNRQCALAGACAPGPYGVNACTNRPPECRRGRCQVLGQHCNCPMNWDPVCAQTHEGGNITFPNQCQADCLGFDWDYQGRCACEMACRDPNPVCASNGLTYWCGAEEALCSGHRIRYPGYCDPACDYCESTVVDEVPVCGVDFISYLDACYAECHDVSWWHEGECLQGEGDTCDAGTSPIPCSSDDLYCLPDYDCPDCPGCACPATCIKLGACRWPGDCSRQAGLPHDDCNGRWTCQEHACTWVCD
jgi:hypothetical protein